ncbi:MAG: PTPA-domain-containing protein [Monoraphidium minutum]|nr:MAG: PTPA-domain-containing protein [Monoraphidium minutum]
MSPTAAPWAVGAVPPAAPAFAPGGAPGAAPAGAAALLRRPPGAASGGMHTGRPTAALVEAAPRMPAARSGGGGPPPQFEAPSKRICSEEDLRRFLEGEAAKDFVAFILALNQAATGTKLSPPPPLSPPLAAIAGALDTLREWVDEVPPAAQSLRYGNPAYREWFARMAAAAPGFMRQVLPEHLAGAAAELTPYFVDAFGNATRLDYGTGHETAFAALLYCLAALGAVGDGDGAALVNVIFNKYLLLMRHIQTTYWLEPAGSHGVWGLDDYQFLPFVWGSAQLVGHPVIRPKSIHNPEVLEAYAGDYMYLGCVAFVKQVKKGPLFETSPMLNDVSGVPTWSKVNGGMLKMYQAEVLGKFPIMQHFLFGSLLKWA